MLVEFISADFFIYNQQNEQPMHIIPICSTVAPQINARGKSHFEFSFFKEMNIIITKSKIGNK